MKNISVIFFDLGLTLIRFDWSFAFAKLQGRHDPAIRLDENFIYQNTPYIDFELGKITSTVFFDEVALKIGFKGTTDELREIYSDIFIPMPWRVKRAESLQQNHRLAVISNTSEPHITFLKQHHNFFPLFEREFFSYEMGLRKPDPQIYLECARQMKVEPTECLLIDDRQDNCEGAFSVGFTSVHIAAEEDLDARLTHLGIH